MTAIPNGLFGVIARKNGAGGGSDITLETSVVTTATSYSAPLNIDVNIPAVSANDILLLFCTTNDYSEPTASPPSGWTKITEQDGTSTSVPTVAAYWKRASGSASATTETWSAFYPNGELYYIWVGAYSGCVIGSSPVDAYGQDNVGYSATFSVPVSTTTADTKIVTIASSTNPLITFTWADGTELVDTVFRSAAVVTINEKLEATSGSKTRTVTASSPSAFSGIAVALKPV